MNAQSKKMNTEKCRFRLLTLTLLGIAYLAAPLQAQEEEYQAKVWRSADEVLSGEWAKQLPEPLPMPYEFSGPAPARPPQVPPPGVHPRIMTHPDEIEAIRVDLASETPDPYLLANWERLKTYAEGDAGGPEGLRSHWAFFTPLAARGMVALIEQDEDLGKAVAAKVVERALWLEGVADGINEIPVIRDDYYIVRSVLPDPESESGYKQGLLQLQSTGLAQEYDYAHPFMTEEQRSIARRAISKWTHNRYLSSMEMPAQFSMNNHISLGQNFFLLVLAIEGEEGYDERIMNVAMDYFTEHIAWTISPEGVGFEQTKGFINGHVFLAFARRNPQLLQMDRVWAYLSYMARQAVYLEGKGWDVVDKENGTLLKAVQAFYPEHPLVDFVYKNFFPLETHRASRGHSRHDLDLLTMRAGLRNEDGSIRSYEQSGPPAEVKALGLSWMDPMRGFATVRSDWSEDALLTQYEARNDFYYSGHETPNYGDFNLYANGQQWILKQTGYSEPYYHNMTSVNGIGPKTLGAAAARIASIADNGAGATLVSDHANGWRWGMIPGGHDLSHPMYNDVPFFMFNRQSVFSHDRGTTVPVPDRIRRFYEGYAHTDYGPWHGENRGPYFYNRWLDIDGYHRTFHVVRGEHPYVLLLDDFNKDGEVNQYNMGLQIAQGARLVSINSKSHTTSGMNIGEAEQVPASIIGTDFTFARDDAAAGANPAAGAPMLLVRVLWRNANYPYPLPSFNQIQVGQTGSYTQNIAGRISIPAHAVDPEYRILLYPYRQGDPLPITEWNQDRSVLNVTIGGQADQYLFAGTTAGAASDSPGAERTLFVQERDGAKAAVNAGLPPTPRLASVTRDGQTLSYKTLGLHNDLSVGGGHSAFGDSMRLAFEPPRDGQRIEYRLDGGDWTPYTEPVRLERSAEIEARTLARVWPFGETPVSEIFTWSCEQQAALASTGAPDAIRCRVYEYRRTVYDERGFYTGTKTLMGDLDAMQPIFEDTLDALDVPETTATLPMSRMAKATYRYDLPFQADRTGVYRFRLHSPGPLYLEVNGTRVMDNPGPHRVDTRDYFADVVLEAGNHHLSLAVTDPIYWKGDMAEPFTFALGVLRPGSPLPLRYEPLYPAVEDAKPRAVASFQALKVAPADGFVREIYNAIGRNPFSLSQAPADGVPADFFGIDSERLVETAQVPKMTVNDSYHGMHRYLGYYYASIPGVYVFRLDGDGANQFYLHDRLINENLVDRAAPGASGVELAAGWHPIDIRLGKSSPTLRVKGPLDTDFQSVNLLSIGAPPDRIPEEPSDAELLKKDLVAQGPGGDRELPLVKNATTVMMWMRIDPSNGKETITLFENYTAMLRYGSSFRSGHWHYGAFLQQGIGVPQGEWFHLATTYDSEGIKLFVNGERIGIGRQDARIRNHRFPEISVEGSSETVERQDIRIYNRSATPELLKAVMEASKPSDR